MQAFPSFRQLFGLALLVAAVAVPLLPPSVAAPLLVAVAIAWAVTRPPRREIAVGAVALLLAAAALAVGGWLAGRSGPREEGWQRQARFAYGELWGGLLQAAERARADLPSPPNESISPPPAADRLAWFGALASERGSGDGSPDRGPALLLVDRDGVAVAWGGRGLLHELRPEDIPAAGTSFQGSFSAVTLLAVVPLDESRRPWRVVAAESFATDRLPFAGRFSGAPALRWSLVDDPAAAAADAVVVTREGAPAMAVEATAAADAASAGPWRTLAWTVLGFGLLALAVMRGVGLALPAGGAHPPRPPGASVGAVAALAVAGGLACGLAAAAPPLSLAVLAGGIVLAAIAFAAAAKAAPVSARRRTGSGWSRRLAAASLGALAMGLVALVARLVQSQTGAVDLAGELTGGAGTYALRLGVVAAAFGLLRVAGRVGTGSGGAEPVAGDGLEDRWAWGAVGLLLLAGAVHDDPPVAVVLLALGGAAAAVWVGDRRTPRSAGRVATWVLIAALAGATAWEIAYRAQLRADLAGPLLAGMAPVAGDDLAGLEREAARFFASRDVARLAPRTPAGLDHQDLALVLWRDSPLARANALSAVVVEPLAGAASTFSFGLPLDEERRVDWGSSRLLELGDHIAAGGVIQGEAELTSHGARWAVVRYWLVPWVGYRLEASPGLGEVEVGLLRGGPAASRRVAGLPEPALFAHYSAGGRALLSPWEEAPPLPAELARGTGGTSTVTTPDGRAQAFSRLAADGWEVLYLPLLTPIRALERIGTQAVAVLLVVALALAVAMLLALPRAPFRDFLARAVRSYSKRLLIVYTLLLLVPLLLLNAVLVAAVEKRLSLEQRAAGEAALTSAQRLVGDYLRTLEPGFGLDTVFNDELMIQLSRVVRHEINLYWGSAVYASSKPELFAAGLLPKRIPGDIYARLALFGYELASRTNRAGNTSYLELYAPLQVIDAPLGPGRLFLSMPLLAQQEEVAEELATLRRQALLVTAALFALLVAVAVRLAHNFTTPLAELVEGTRRIAAGAPSLDLAPTELELAALVEAVDEMAGRIAEGRDQLVREKQVVERMVENITSGVVSLDGDRRVLMRNRVAAELLGVEVGQALDEVLAAAGATERLAPVAEFLAGVGEEPATRTVRLRAEGGDEREWSLVWVPVPGAGEPAALLVVEDATETLRGQRLEAWAEMARMIAHEIKNPLTPIRLNVEHMRQVWRDGGERFDEVFARCTDNVLAQVDELRQIAAEFSAYSSIPRLDRKAGDLVAAMRRLVEPYRAAPPGAVAVEFEAAVERLEARFDAKLLGRAVRNLLENALRASGDGCGQVTVRVEPSPTAGGEARIVVSDCGPGVHPAFLARIFDPYFSTHDSGTGLGLPIARRIAEEHGGSIHARNRPGGGLEVTITIPL